MSYARSGRQHRQPALAGRVLRGSFVSAPTPFSDEGEISLLLPSRPAAHVSKRPALVAEAIRSQNKANWDSGEINPVTPTSLAHFQPMDKAAGNSCLWEVVKADSRMKAATSSLRNRMRPNNDSVLTSDFQICTSVAD